ncbi:hypothetical protein [Massilia sp. TWR1-2-2]|uniref:hypothetical protein n=1 Tax=Massilia sp. TWR1-2-2 TaxID=2804584 RepID=UPI003CF4F980
MTHLARWTLPIAACAALLAACGGGGGGGGASPPPVVSPGPVVATVNVAAAWRDYLTVAHSWKMAGKGSDGRAYELAVDMKPGPTATFAMTGSSGQTVDQSVRFTINGATNVTNGALYFTNDTFIGEASTDGSCAPARGAIAALPAAASVGQQGDLFVLDGYAGCKVTGQRLGSTAFSWSVEEDAGVTLFCITSKQTNAEGANIGGEVDCIEASAGGTLGNRAKFTISRADGQSLGGRNY